MKVKKIFNFATGFVLVAVWGFVSLWFFGDKIWRSIMSCGIIYPNLFKPSLSIVYHVLAFELLYIVHYWVASLKKSQICRGAFRVGFWFMLMVSPAVLTFVIPVLIQDMEFMDGFLFAVLLYMYVVSSFFWGYSLSGDFHKLYGIAEKFNFFDDGKQGSQAQFQTSLVMLASMLVCTGLVYLAHGFI